MGPSWEEGTLQEGRAESRLGCQHGAGSAGWIPAGVGTPQAPAGQDEGGGHRTLDRRVPSCHHISPTATHLEAGTETPRLGNPWPAPGRRELENGEKGQCSGVAERRWPRGTAAQGLSGEGPQYMPSPLSHGRWHGRQYQGSQGHRRGQARRDRRGGMRECFRGGGGALAGARSGALASRARGQGGPCGRRRSSDRRLCVPGGDHARGSCARRPREARTPGAGEPRDMTWSGVTVRTEGLAVRPSRTPRRAPRGSCRQERVSVPSVAQGADTHTHIPTPAALWTLGTLRERNGAAQLKSGPSNPGTRESVLCESRRLCLRNLDTALLRSQLPGDAQGRRPRPHRHQQQRRPQPLAPCHSIGAATLRHPVLPELGPPRGGPHRLPLSFLFFLSLSA